MNTRLELITCSETGLCPDSAKDLERQIKALADLCEKDRRSMERLAFSCVLALGAEEIGHSAVQSFLNCLIGGRAWAAVRQDLKAARYGAQCLLRELADRGLMEYDLLTALANHADGPAAAALNACRREMAESAALRYDAGFIGWLNDLETNPHTHGVPYWTMDTAARLVWLARDFWEATGGRWTTAELLMLGDAMTAVKLTPDERISYFDFAQAVARDGALRRRLLGGRQLRQMPDGHLLPLAGAELLALLDGEKRSAADAVVTAMNLRGARTSRAALGDSLLDKLVGRQIAGDGTVSCLNFLLELLYDLRAAARDGLFAPVPQAKDELCWEIRLFRAASGITGWRWGSGSGSGSGSGRSGSGSGRAGSGRSGSGGSAGAVPTGGIFAGGGLSGDGFGGVYGLELIDAPRSESAMLDWLLAMLGGGAAL